jgi:hypothetical protein
MQLNADALSFALTDLLFRRTAVEANWTIRLDVGFDELAGCSLIM